MYNKITAVIKVETDIITTITVSLTLLFLSVTLLCV